MCYFIDLLNKSVNTGAYNPCKSDNILSVLLSQNNQADLENATEVLSGYLERDISQDSLQDIKQKVQDKYR